MDVSRWDEITASLFRFDVLDVLNVDWEAARGLDGLSEPRKGRRGKANIAIQRGTSHSWGLKPLPGGRLPWLRYHRGFCQFRRETQINSRPLPSCSFPIHYSLIVLLSNDMYIHIWAGYRSRYSDCLRAGRSGDRIPVEARFSAPVETGPESHLVSCTMGTGSFPGVRCGRGVTLNPHAFLVPRSKIE
jgi:hypothetical protein